RGDLRWARQYRRGRPRRAHRRRGRKRHGRVPRPVRGRWHQGLRALSPHDSGSLPPTARLLRARDHRARMIQRECGVFETTYRADMALFRLPLAKAAAWGSLALLVALPLPFWLAHNEHGMSIVTGIMLAAIGAIGLNILTGSTGQISLGQGGFM